MAYEVCTWNIKDGFSDTARAEHLISDILRHPPDVAVLLEAYSERRPQLAINVAQEFESQGFTVTHGLYDDADSRVDRHGLMLLMRPSLIPADAPPTLIRLGGRTAVKATLEGPEGARADIFGIHFDDRSEPQRLNMARAMQLHTATDENGQFANTTIVASNFNALHGHKASSRALRMVRPFIGLLPEADPNPIDLPPVWKYRVGQLRRLSDMAIGSTMQMLESYGLEEIDTYGLSTTPAARPVLPMGPRKT